MICKVCANDFPNLSALLLHQSIAGCSSCLAAASLPACSSTASASLLASAPSSAPALSLSGTDPLDSIVALDCEMVAVEDARSGQEKSALARVAIVDWRGGLLLDTFVRPKEKVCTIEHISFHMLKQLYLWAFIPTFVAGSGLSNLGFGSMC